MGPLEERKARHWVTPQQELLGKLCEETSQGCVSNSVLSPVSCLGILLIVGNGSVRGAWEVNVAWQWSRQLGTEDRRAEVSLHFSVALSEHQQQNQELGTQRRA